MFARIVALLQTTPFTGCLLLACPILWVLDLAVGLEFGLTFQAASAKLGAYDEFALWEGEWWRVITTAFHHGGIIHLLCNLSLIGLFGRFLELRMGSAAYGLFSIVAITVSGIAQAFWGGYVGLSGLGFAQFGLIWLWRRHDAWWQKQISDTTIQMGFVWFFSCFVLDQMGVLPLGNVAHAAGLVYGICVGFAGYQSTELRRLWPLLVLAHVLVIPGFLLLTHPVWNGKYHWRRGDMARNPIEKFRYYRTAIEKNPELDGPWINLALLCLSEREPLEAWRYIIQGLARHTTSEKIMEVAREVGRNLITPQQRSQARDMLRELFGDNSALWDKKLLEEVLLQDLPQLQLPDIESERAKDLSEENTNVDEPDLPQLPTILPKHALDEVPFPGKKLPPPDPNIPGGAEEGRAA